MTTPLRLQLPLDKFDALYEAAHAKGRTAHIPKADLLALLMDHSAVIAELHQNGVQTTEPEYANHREVRKARAG